MKVDALCPGRSVREPRATSVLLTSGGVGKPLQKSVEAIVDDTFIKKLELLISLYYL